MKSAEKKGKGGRGEMENEHTRFGMPGADSSRRAAAAAWPACMTSAWFSAKSGSSVWMGARAKVGSCA